MTKYLVNQSTIDSIVFKYLNLKELEKIKVTYYERIIFVYPNEEFGILGYKNDGTLYIYLGLIDEISLIFGLDKSDSESIIGRWVSDRYQLEVRNTKRIVSPYTFPLLIYTN